MTFVVIATYNEADSIGRILNRLKDYRVIIVDDSSPDGTGDICERYENVVLITRPFGQGLVSAYLLGLENALAGAGDTDYIIQMGAGFAHDPDDIANLLWHAQNQEADLIIGSRFKHPTTLFTYRTVISKTAAFLMRCRGLSVRDATSGFRCWRAGFLRKLDFAAVKSRKFAFEIELLYQAFQMGGIIDECAIEYKLTNSSFRWPMLWEAVKIYAGLGRFKR